MPVVENSEGANEESQQLVENPRGENRESNPASIIFSQTTKIMNQPDEELSSSDIKIRKPITPDGQSEESPEFVRHSVMQNQSTESSDNKSS